MWLCLGHAAQLEHLRCHSVREGDGAGWRMNSYSLACARKERHAHFMRSGAILVRDQRPWVVRQVFGERHRLFTRECALALYCIGTRVCSTFRRRFKEENIAFLAAEFFTAV